MKKMIVLTGAGMSAESGINTFRDHNGLWENNRVEDVATPEAWQKNPALVNEFYNQRRKQLMEVQPNTGHLTLVEMEKHFDVHIITQNVDDLHERAGSKNVLHLHGELKKVRSSVDPDLIFELEGWELRIGDLCPKGSQLRPHIVWFGEYVPMIESAIELASQAEILVVIGTSMAVYPAASLVHYVTSNIPKYYIDPKAFPISGINNLQTIREKAGIGVKTLMEKLL